MNVHAINTYRGGSSGGPGISLRGRKIRAINSGSDGSQLGGFGVYSSGRDGPDDDILVDNCYVRNAADIAIRFSVEAETSGITNIVIRNSSFESSSTLAVNRGPSNVKWENVKFKYISNLPSLNQPSSAISFINDLNDGSPSHWEMTGCEFDLRLAPTNIVRLFRFESPNFTLYGDENKILHAGNEMERVFLRSGGVTGVSVRFTRTYMDALVTDRVYETDGLYTEMRWSMRGAADTRLAVQAESAPAGNLGNLDPTIFGGNRLNSWSEDEATLRLVLTRSTPLAPFTFSTALQPGMFNGQRINLRFETAGATHDHLWIPGKGRTITLPRREDLLLSSGESVVLDWQTNTWMVTTPPKQTPRWWASKGGIALLSGASSTNAVYSELTGMTNLIGGQPWTLLWVGEIPDKVYSQTWGMIQTALDSGWAAPVTNTTRVLLRSSGTMEARYVNGAGESRDFIFNNFAPYWGGQTIELALTRPRGTNIFAHVNGTPLTWDTAPGIDASDTLPDTFFVQSGGVTSFTGQFRSKQRMFALLPYAVRPGSSLRMSADGPDYFTLSSGTVSAANDTINFRQVELQTGAAITCVSEAQPGITTGETYYVRHVSGFDYTLHPTEADAWTDDNRVDITSGVSGSQWQVRPTMLCVFEDETGGTIADRSGNGFDATVEGAYEKF
jgi:hypothetical protein